MNPTEMLRLVDVIHREKNIDKEIVFQAIESALVTAAKRQYGEDQEIVVHINRTDGSITATRNGEPLDPEETGGRIGAQTAKQVIIQKVREAERDSLYEEYEKERNQLVTGIVQRYEGGAATVALHNCEAILPRSEQIPGETHHANERVRATVCEVRKVGSRVKVILSRTRPALVQRLFEQEIPEIADGVIQIRAMAREPGYRTKVAVSSTDQRVDCVGACVGVRGNRIKNIVDELAGERIDIVRWSDDLQVLIPNALQPAEVEEVILCEMLGRAIVLVREDQLSLAIGRGGQNVRLASKLCGLDIEIMTREELDEQIERAVKGFSSLEGVDEALAEKLVGEGYLSYDDLSVIEPDVLMELGGLTPQQVDAIVAQAEARAAEAEAAASEERKRQRELARQKAAAGEAEASPVPDEPAWQAGPADALAAPHGGAAQPEPLSDATAESTGPAADLNGSAADEGPEAIAATSSTELEVADDIHSGGTSDPGMAAAAEHASEAAAGQHPAPADSAAPSAGDEAGSYGHVPPTGEQVDEATADARLPLGSFAGDMAAPPALPATALTPEEEQNEAV
ncbi:MAG: transcription termination factor NusA [Pirellulales bacterium]|nr:transcription termination factor NusA [Pirellulales bacterium]